MSPIADFTAILATAGPRRPDAVAISFGGTHRTWAQLAERVRRAPRAARRRPAARRPHRRAGPEPPVLPGADAGLRADRHANAVVNFRLAPPEIVYVINDAKARLLFVGPEFAAPWPRCAPAADGIERVIALGGDPTTTKPGWPRTHPTRVHPAAHRLLRAAVHLGHHRLPQGRDAHPPRHAGARAQRVGHCRTSATTPRVQVAMPLFHVGGTSYALVALTAGAPST
jgi:hypothetical protein